MAGGALIDASTGDLDTGGPGDGGSIDIAGRRATLRGGAQITVASNATATGNAGDIRLVLDDELHMDESAIVARAVNSDGGNIGIEVEDTIHLVNSEITANVIAHNGQDGIAGTIPSSGGTMLAANNTIVANRNGVRLDYFADKVTLRRNIIVQNSSYGIDCGSPYGLWPVLVENDVWGNQLGSYSGPVSAPSDISADPLFCAPWQDDYSLQSNSPCIFGPGNLIGALRPGC